MHEGIRRSQYGEVSEAIFLTQGFVYPDAAAAEALGLTVDELVQLARTSLEASFADDGAKARWLEELDAYAGASDPGDG